MIKFLLSFEINSEKFVVHFNSDLNPKLTSPSLQRQFKPSSTFPGYSARKNGSWGQVHEAKVLRKTSPGGNVIKRFLCWNFRQSEIDTKFRRLQKLNVSLGMLVFQLLPSFLGNYLPFKANNYAQDFKYSFQEPSQFLSEF